MPWNEICMIWVIWELLDGSSREVWSSSLPFDHSHSGVEALHQYFEKNKFVLKWFLCNFKCFKLMYFSKQKLTENWSAADPNHPP